ncbi:hypothetical protein D3C71_2123830 [compost metagenome]
MLDAEFDPGEERGIWNQLEHDPRTAGAGMLRALFAALLRLLNKAALRQFGNDLA